MRRTKKKVIYYENPTEKLSEELKFSKSLIKDWDEDNGDTFICKTCRKCTHIELKSKEKIGSCIRCTGEDPINLGGY